MCSKYYGIRRSGLVPGNRFLFVYLFRQPYWLSVFRMENPLLLKIPTWRHIGQGHFEMGLSPAKENFRRLFYCRNDGLIGRLSLPSFFLPTRLSIHKQPPWMTNLPSTNHGLNLFVHVKRQIVVASGVLPCGTGPLPASERLKTRPGACRRPLWPVRIGYPASIRSKNHLASSSVPRIRL